MGTTAQKLAKVQETKTALAAVLTNHSAEVPSTFAGYPQAFENAIQAGGGGGGMTPGQRSFLTGFTTGSNFQSTYNNDFSIDMYAVSSCTQLTAVNILQPFFNGTYHVKVNMYESETYVQPVGNIYFHDIKVLGDGMSPLTSNMNNIDNLWSLSADSTTDLCIMPYCFPQGQGRMQMMSMTPIRAYFKANGDLTFCSYSFNGSMPMYPYSGFDQLCAMTISGTLGVDNYAFSNIYSSLSSVLLSSETGDVVVQDYTFWGLCTLTSFDAGSMTGNLSIGNCALSGAFQDNTMTSWVSLSGNTLCIGLSAFSDTCLNNVYINGANEQELKAMNTYGTWFCDSPGFQRSTGSGGNQVWINWIKGPNSGSFQWISPNTITFKSSYGGQSDTTVTLTSTGMYGVIGPNDIDNGSLTGTMMYGWADIFEFGNDVTSIYSDTFTQCTSFVSAFCNKCSSIGNNAFYGCTSLTWYDLTGMTSSDISSNASMYGIGQSMMGTFIVSCNCQEGVIVLNEGGGGSQVTKRGSWYTNDSGPSYQNYSESKDMNYNVQERIWDDGNGNQLVYATEYDQNPYISQKNCWYTAQQYENYSSIGYTDPGLTSLYFNGYQYYWLSPGATSYGSWYPRNGSSVQLTSYNYDKDPDTMTDRARYWFDQSEGHYLYYITDFGVSYYGVSQKGWYSKYAYGSYSYLGNDNEMEDVLQISWSDSTSDTFEWTSSSH